MVAHERCTVMTTQQASHRGLGLCALEVESPLLGVGPPGWWGCWLVFTKGAIVDSVSGQPRPSCAPVSSALPGFSLGSMHWCYFEVVMTALAKDNSS